MYPGDGVQAVLDGLAVLLVEVPVVGFGDLVGPQALAHVHGVRHGQHRAGVGRLELVHEADDPAELLDHAIELVGPDLEAGKVSDVLDVLAGELHDVLGSSTS